MSYRCSNILLITDYIKEKALLCLLSHNTESLSEFGVIGT